MNNYRYRQIQLLHRAVLNRKRPTYAESVAWDIALSINKDSFKFQRVLLNSYIVDLFHIPTRTVIEIDGKYHTGYKQQGYDERRERRLLDHGYDVWRFWNEEVKTKYFEECLACLDFRPELISVPFERRRCAKRNRFGPG